MGTTSSSTQELESTQFQSLIAEKDNSSFQIEPLVCQARPWLESTQFQSLIAEKGQQCFQIEPLVLSEPAPLQRGAVRDAGCVSLPRDPRRGRAAQA